MFFFSSFRVKLHKALESEIVAFLDCLFLFSQTCPAAKAESMTSLSEDFALIFLALNSLPRLHSPSGSLLICQPVHWHTCVRSLWIKILLSQGADMQQDFIVLRARPLRISYSFLGLDDYSQSPHYCCWLTGVHCGINCNYCHSADVRLHHSHWGVCH